METPSKLSKWKRALLVVLLICLVPFAPELLILVDVLGLEAALLFFFLYSQNLLREYSDRASYAYYFLEAKVNSKERFPQINRVGFGVSAVASVATLLVTGSLALALFTWSPLLLSASQIVA